MSDPEPRFYTAREGGEWHEWPPRPMGPGGKLLENGSPRGVIFAILFNNNRVLDPYGWRDPVRSVEEVEKFMKEKK